MSIFSIFFIVNLESHRTCMHNYAHVCQQCCYFCSCAKQRTEQQQIIDKCEITEMEFRHRIRMSLMLMLRTYPRVTQRERKVGTVWILPVCEIHIYRYIYIYLYIYVYPRHFLKYDAVVFPEHDVTWWVTQRFASHHGGVVARWRPGRHAFGPHPMRRLRPGWYVVEHSWDFTKSPRGRQKSRAVDVEQLNVLNVLNWLYWIVLILIVEFAVERGKTW